MTRWRSCRIPATLTRLRHRPEMYLAHPYALPLAGVAVPLIVDDDFYERAREHRLPDCSVSFLMRAGSWSARNSRSGFVPSSMLADFSDEPDLVTRTLRAAGFVKRTKGGVRIAPGHGLTVVNASDEAERVTRDKADAERRRAEWRERKSRQRDAEKAERQEQITAGVTPASRGTTADVTRDKAPIPKKPQVNGSHVTRDISVTSRVTPQIDRSDQDQSSSGASQSDAHARDPDLLRIVAAGFSKKAGRIISDPEAATVIRTLTKRAEDAGTIIGRPRKYFAASVRNEADVELLLLGDPPRLAKILAEPMPPPPGRHPYEHDKKTSACGHSDCGLPRWNARHQDQEARTG